MKTTQKILVNAKSAVTEILHLSEDTRNELLSAFADAIEEGSTSILAENQLDVSAARGKISDVMIDRLQLSDIRIKGMADGIRNVAKLNCNSGKVLTSHKRNDGLQIDKVCVPLGVVAIIYESRPNVTSDAAALCFKSGNICVLRCGKEAFRTAKRIVDILRATLKSRGFNENFINITEDTTRKSANELMTAEGLVDLLIPRGGKGLIKACVENATVPCIETGTGICHIYVDEYADINKALDIVENAKASRPSVCNAAEVCLVHKNIAKEFLPKLFERFTENWNYHSVELRGDEKTCEIINAAPALDGDFDTEFLDYIMAVKVVDSIDEAVEHIKKHSTHHSEAIITESRENADYFTLSVDSAAVYVNASTRFTDGGEFGLGCEMGISTQKLHARGPMGLNELTTYKYIIHGNGNIR